MIGAIPNPTKTVTVNYSIEEVKKAVKNVNSTYDGLTVGKHDEIMNLFKFAKTEFLSLGVEIDIVLEEISETRTKIEVEIKRAVGSFDKWHEVSNAKKHIDAILSGISKLLSSDNIEMAAAAAVQVTQKKKNTFGWFIGQFFKWTFVGIFFLVLVAYLFS